MEKLLIFVGMALATYFTRYALIALLGRRQPVPYEVEDTGLLRRWLRHVPPAVLAALITPAVLAPQGHLELGLPALSVLVGGVVAWRTRSVLWTILGGIVAFWLCRALGL
jgi:branched-subunit amino acid transport protein